MRIGPSEGVEVPELKDDTSRLRYVELRKAIDPRSEIRYVVLGHGELSLCISVEICGGFPERGVQRVHAIPELLQSGYVLRQEHMLVVERHGAALQQLDVESLQRRALGTARHGSLLSEQSHGLEDIESVLPGEGASLDYA